MCPFIGDVDHSHPNVNILPPRAGTRPVSVEQDPYLFLENLESEESMDFAKLANEKCLNVLGDPRKKEGDTQNMYDRVLAAVENIDRIPHVCMLGYDEASGDMLLYNFWKDDHNPIGVWRRTTLNLYKTTDPQWTTVLDLDKLALKENISWTWRGFVALPRSLDPCSGYRPNSSKPRGQVTRVLLHLSRGGTDSISVREFDLITESFVDPNDSDEPGFMLPEAKTRASYKSRDVLLVGTDVGPESLTASGHPRTVREWIRGTKIEDAPIVFEGDTSDVSVSAVVYDQRHRVGGSIFELRQKSLPSFASKILCRKLEYIHCLPPSKMSKGLWCKQSECIELAILLDTDVSFFGKWLLLSLRTDWEPEDNYSGRVFYSGSLVCVDAELFLEFSKAKEKEIGNFDSDLETDDDIKEAAAKLEYQVLFEPSDTSSYVGFSTTKNFLIVHTLEDVKQRFKFFKLGGNGGSFIPVRELEKSKIRAAHASGIDPIESDLFWLTCSNFTHPNTLFLADGNKCNQIAGLTSVEAEKSVSKADDYIISKVKSLPHLYDSSSFEVSQRFAISHDGTKIPFFMVSKKGITFDGAVPTLLHGYGGFEVSLVPRYLPTIGISWLERGGVYVEANIRGGGEYGPYWHQAALRQNRNKSFEDFISVALYLFSINICSPKTLACSGGSNGGLLMGNMLVKAPDLFGAIHAAVPLLDMKRYHKLLGGASWMVEYGNPDTIEWELFLKYYSPYHNIDSTREKYPPVLFTSSTNEKRVHPAHARKMVKKLWDLGEGKDWPVFYYENIEGSGGETDSKQLAFMITLSHDFLWQALTSSLSKN